MGSQTQLSVNWCDPCKEKQQVLKATLLHFPTGRAGSWNALSFTAPFCAWERGNSENNPNSAVSWKCRVQPLWAQDERDVLCLTSPRCIPQHVLGWRVHSTHPLGTGCDSTFFSKYLRSLTHTFSCNVQMVQKDGIRINLDCYPCTGVCKGRQSSCLYWEEKGKHIGKVNMLLTPLLFLFFPAKESPDFSRLLIIYRLLSMDVVMCLQ